MEKYIVVLDLGTTGNRAIVFDRKGRVTAKSYYEFPQIYPKPGWVEENPVDILNTAVKALNDVIMHVGAENILSMGITNQRETVVLWNKNTGKPVYNAIVWQCRRTKQMCDDLRRHRDFIKKKTGLFLDPYFSATKIKWLIDNVSGVKDDIRKGDVIFGTVDSWILWNLTARKVHATEVTNASRTLLLNIKTLKYDPDLLDIFDIPDNILPEVKNSDALFGLTDKNITGKEIPVTAILGDQQASLFAHGGFNTGVIKNTYGTGLFVMTQSGEELIASDKLISTVAWMLNGRTYYALEGGVFAGGAVIQWLRDGLKLIKSPDETALRANVVKSNEGVYFVPALSGLGAPYWDPDARGLIIGITGGTTADHIIRAALESMCYSTKDIIYEFESLMGSGHKLRVDGKASENDFLMQFQADILNMTVEKPAITEMTAYGVAGMAGISAGFWTIDEFLDLLKIEKNYIPSIDEKTRDKYYNRWQKAVRRAFKWTN